MAVLIRSQAEVRDPSGAVRPPMPAAPRRWHASLAYFRRSQITDNLHESYRNLFLALESLLSEVYPWEAGKGERTWIRDALKHVAEGYGIDIRPYLTTTRGNPYKRFLKEQYQASRCALFHSKLSAGPALPGDMATRDDLAIATRRLGQLYVQLSRLITGAGFGGGSMSSAAFAAMMGSQREAMLYVSEDRDFNLAKCVQQPSQLIMNANAHVGLHLLRARWKHDTLPPRVSRVGSLVRTNGGTEDAMSSGVDIETARVGTLEVILQQELGNAEQLREWFL